MPHRHDSPNAIQQKTLIASTAARLIAESGISDYSIAKRKAAHSLGLPEGTNLPENAEVEAELRTYQRLFQGDEHIERIDALRHKAGAIMEVLQKFTPYLTGSVLDGTAGRYAEIDIQLFTDSAKDVEIFLLNQHIEFEHSTPRSDRAEAVLTLNDDGAVINLIVYPRIEERVVLKTRDGRPRQRVRLDALKKLLAESPSTP
ncbi:MAG: hypothetical protein KA779_14515 [Propionivibrio sp.]|jgi:hypothetical protein|nr:hypothetical protein [Propionivibrio sp.]MBP6711818.1 hypothetical protein [Propionivibrio sp.]MBP7525974.1 hypothetical protein [Propionivibrio sp.]